MTGSGSGSWVSLMCWMQLTVNCAVRAVMISMGPQWNTTESQPTTCQHLTFHLFSTLLLISFTRLWHREVLQAASQVSTGDKTVPVNRDVGGVSCPSRGFVCVLQERCLCTVLWVSVAQQHWSWPTWWSITTSVFCPPYAMCNRNAGFSQTEVSWDSL